MPKDYSEIPHLSNDHKIRAKHDEALAEMLCRNKEFSDWSITCSFYFALHCVDAYAHKLRIKSFERAPDESLSAHGKRKRFVRNNLGSFFNNYCKLYSRCHQCRYDPKYFKLMRLDIPGKMLKIAREFLTIR